MAMQVATLHLDVVNVMMQVSDNPELVRKFYVELAGAPDAQELLTPLEGVNQLYETMLKSAPNIVSVSLAQMIGMGEKWLRALYNQKFADEVVRLWWETFPQYKAQAADVQEYGVPR